MFIDFEKQIHSNIHIYLIEVKTLTDFILQNCESIFDLMSQPEKGMYIKVDPGSQLKINQIIVSIGNIKKMIYPSSIKSKNESKKSFDFRKKRGAILKDLLNIDGNEYFLNLKARNSIEHFDEKIDQVNLNLLNKDSKLMNKPAILYNMTISTRSVFFPEPYYLKVYIADEKTAIIDGKELNLENVYKELKKLSSWLDTAENLEGGLLLKI